MTVKTIPRHARTLDRQRWVPRPSAGTLPSPAAPGTAPPQLADGWVPTGPLTGPAAITERAVLGDTIRRPIVWCEMPCCISRHEHPAALGEADIRARALAAGWCHDAVGRLVCPSCQQRNPDLWIAHRLARQPHAQARGCRQHTGHARAGRLSDVWAAVSAWARAFADGQDGRPRWPHMLAALVSADNGWNTPPAVSARRATGRRHRAGPAVPGRPAGHQAVTVALAQRGGYDDPRGQERQSQQRHGRGKVSAWPARRVPPAHRTTPQHHRR